MRQVPKDLKALHAELQTLQWIGADKGWDAAIDAVSARIALMLATPTPIPDAGEVERLVTEQVKHAYYERKTITEAVGEIVSALQADHIEGVRAMVVPDGWRLVPVEPTEAMLKGPRHDGYTFSVRNLYRAMLAAAPAPGDSQ